MTRHFGIRTKLGGVLVEALLPAMLAAFCAAVAMAQPQQSAAPPQPADNGKRPAKENAAPADPGKPADEAETTNARDAELGEGRLIRVRLPLTGNADAHIKRSIDRAVEQLSRIPRTDDRRPLLVLELVPDRRRAPYGEGTDFTRALSLADYLTRKELASVKTVAYVPQTIKGHGVLVALACEELVMSADAEIGEAGIDEDPSRPIDSKTISSYQQIAGSRSSVPEAVALAMLDRRLEALKVETEQGIEFVLKDDLDDLKRRHTIVSAEPLAPAGSMVNITGRDGRENTFVKVLARDREALARGLALKPDSMVEDQSLLGDWREVMLTIKGPIDSRMIRQLHTLMGTELRDRKVNWIGLTIDSNGGELEDCLRLANTIAEYDPNEVQTVAYVPVEASGGAALVALACDHLVMQPEAHLGGKGTVEMNREMLDEATISIRDSLGKNADHSWSLLAATIDPDIELTTYHNNKTGENRYFSAEEAGEQPDAGDWQPRGKIKPAGEPLRLSAERAAELHVATQVVDSFDEFKQLYGFESDPRVAEPNWALELVEALSSPALAVLLLVIGFVGIYIELHTPGLGAGAFVSALAFLLFFWSNFLHGNVVWFEVLLFLGGVFFLLLELLIMPGFGIFGLGGGAMILAALVLASQTFVLPQTELQREEMRHSLTIVAAATVSVITAAMLLRRYLPHAPMFRTLLLNPPPEDELHDLDYREAIADFSHLLGRQGTAATNLMPSGKAEFDGELVDVIAEGMPIDRGQSVVVVKTRGNRVLVRAANMS